MTVIKIDESYQKDTFYFHFYKNQVVLENSPVCALSLRSAGSMRFRWNEINERRNKYFEKIFNAEKKGAENMDAVARLSGFTPVPVELIHSKDVFFISEAADTFNKQGDGILTLNKTLVPVVTVADCVPVYFYAEDSGTFGVVHSGWKGTGIASEAVNLICKKTGSVSEHIFCAIGPHIHDCCYIVDETRASYFADNFGSDCVKPLEEGGVCFCGGKGLAIEWNNGGGKLYRLSLLRANLNCLSSSKIQEENITIVDECTCCNTLLGSNRRETAFYQAEQSEQTEKTAGIGDSCSDIKKQPAPFTVQAAFIKYM